MSIEIGLLVALLLLLGNAFFVGAEFSLVSVRRSAIEPLASAGSKAAVRTLRALENVSLLMAGAQLGITLCSLGLGAIAEPTIAHVLETPLHGLGVPDAMLHPISFAIALLLTVYLHVVIGEMVPKNIALARPERSALILTPALVAVVNILKPIILLLNAMSNAILRSFGVKPKAEVASTYTRDEMADLVRESRREGYISEDNENLLSGVLTFDDQTVQGIIIPKEKIIPINVDSTYGEVEEIASKSGFSRFPIQDSKGSWKGYVHIKDALQNDKQELSKKISKKKIRKLISIDSEESVRMALKTMQQSGAHIAAVTDKSLAVVGFITMEDVLEELVGEL